MLLKQLINVLCDDEKIRLSHDLLSRGDIYGGKVEDIPAEIMEQYKNYGVSVLFPLGDYLRILINERDDNPHPLQVQRFATKRDTYGNRYGVEINHSKMIFTNFYDYWKRDEYTTIGKRDRAKMIEELRQAGYAEVDYKVFREESKQF